MKMNATDRNALHKQIMMTRVNIQTVVDVYQKTREHTPAETVAAIVERLGYDTACEAIAEIVNTTSEWDGRISRSSRAWAATIESAATPDELEEHRIYQPVEIHPAHIEQLAREMQKYPPAEPQEQEAPAQEAQEPAEIMQQAGAVELPQRVALYVPGTQGPATATDNAAQVERIAAEFCAWFGGATAQESTGFWMSDTAGLVREAVTIVYAACTAEQLRDNLPDVLTLAQKIKAEMQQEAVSIEINGTLYII